MKRETMFERLLRQAIELVDVASIAKKIVLCLIGLFVLLFVFVHLGLNLTVLRNDGGEWFRIAAHFMGSNWIVRILGFVIMAAILAHVALALFIRFVNWRARPIKYEVKTKSKTAFGSKMMMLTGLVILGFLAIHLSHFWFVKMGWSEGRYYARTEHVERALGARQLELYTAFTNTQNEAEQSRIQTEFMELGNFVQNNEHLQILGLPAFGGQRFIIDLSREEIDEMRRYLGSFTYKGDFYAMMHEKFKVWWIVLIYVLSMIALLLHLGHAIPSAFQTLGLAHSKYTWAVKYLGWAVGGIISVGFAIIPLWIFIVR